MTIQLQQFGHRESNYERPTQKWVCGWAAEGKACPMGPDAKGRCTAAGESNCKPAKKGDRWYCTRPQVFGGPCESGPLPDGSCCHPEPQHPVCQPRLSLRARRGRWTLAMCALTAGLLSLIIAGSWGHQLIDPGPLSEQHAVLIGIPPPEGATYCAHCHIEQEGTAGFLQPVTDHACLQCHDAEAHHPAISNASVLNWPRDNTLGQTPMSHKCTDCHIEHRGFDHRLSRVPDTSCTDCHADVSKWRRDQLHPGYPMTLAPARVEPPIERRSTNQVTSFVSNHPLPRVLASPHIDTTPLRFEHHVHMATDETMQKYLRKWVDQLRGRGFAGSQIPVVNVGDGKLQLSCNACHIPDVDGHYMLPIKFETHCVQCHDLGSKTLGERSYAIPHGTQVIDFARHVSLESALIQEEQPQEEESAPQRGPARRGPKGPRGPRSPARSNEETTAEESPQVRVNRETSKLYQLLSTKCGQCHDPAADPTTYADPQIPPRWYTAASFHHETHRFIQCTDCHNINERKIPDELSNPALKWTGRTKELMLPEMDICRTCHAPTAKPTPVRNDCILCHRYHVPKPAWSVDQGVR